MAVEMRTVKREAQVTVCDRCGGMSPPMYEASLTLCPKFESDGDDHSWAGDLCGKGAPMILARIQTKQTRKKKGE